MKRSYLVLATPLLLLTTFALFLFSLPVTQSTVEAQRDRSRVRVTPSVTPEGFVATPSPTPGIKPGGGGCSDNLSSYSGFDIYGFLGYFINEDFDVLTIYGEPEFFDVLPKHAYGGFEVFVDYYSLWMVTVDDTNAFECQDAMNWGIPIGRTHLWSHDDLSGPVATFDVKWDTVEYSPYGDALFGLSQDGLDLVYLENPTERISLVERSNFVDAQWTMEGLLAVLTAPTMGDPERKLDLIDPILGDVILSLSMPDLTNHILTGDLAGNIWVASNDLVTQFNVFEDTSTELFVPNIPESNFFSDPPDPLLFWDIEWSKFMLPVLSKTGQLYVFNVEDLNNPMILDMSDAFPEGKEILSVKWTLDGDELLIGFEGSVAWWSFEDATPRLVDLIPITSEEVQSDGSVAIYGESPTQLHWVLGDTMIVVAMEDFLGFDSALYILDLSNADPLQIIKVDWYSLNFSEDKAVAYIYTRDNGLLQLDLETLELSEVTDFNEVENFYEPIPTPNPAPDFVCDGALPPHLLIGLNGKVDVGEDGILDVYSEATYTSEKLGILPDEALVWILGGPVCGDNGEVWYLVDERGGDFLRGWTTVSGNGEYWIVATDEKYEFDSTTNDDTTFEDTTAIVTEEPMDTDMAIVTEESDSDTVPPPPPLPNTGGFGDLLLIYDETAFTAINISGMDIDFSQVTFYTDSGDGFFGVYWDNDFLTQPIDAFPTDSCLQIWVQGFNDLPTPIECGTRQNWLSGFGIDTFWRESPEFYVGYGDEYVATCDSTFGICEVDLP